MAPKIYLIPQPLSAEGGLENIPAAVAQAIAPLRCFIVEEEKSARRFLKKLFPQLVLADCEFWVFNEHTPPTEVARYLDELKARDVGIISEAGCPCVADPGAAIVLAAHQSGWDVVPLVGPSSILLALMASGMNGQNFAFNGYLPKERSGRIQRIKELERRSLSENQTQLFMETPYRNQNLFEDVLANANPETLLCLAVDLTGPDQFIKTLPVREWKKISPLFHKKPALFLIQKIR